MNWSGWSVPGRCPHGTCGAVESGNAPENHRTRSPTYFLRKSPSYTIFHAGYSSRLTLTLTSLGNTALSSLQRGEQLVPARLFHCEHLERALGRRVQRIGTALE